MLYARSFKKNIFFIFIVAVVLLFTSRVWEAQPLIAHLPSMGFIDFTECMVIFLPMIPISFLLHDTYEIELGLVCGVKTAKLMLSKFFSFYLYTLLVGSVFVLLYKYSPFEVTSGTRVVIPIHVPEDHKVYMLISMFVTVSFFCALFLLVRVATRNCYAPVAVGFFVQAIFSGANEAIHSGSTDIRNSFFDPFISNYFIGNTIPNKYAEAGIWQMRNMWTYNRIFFFALACVMFAVTYILLRREKLHEGYGD